MGEPIERKSSSDPRDRPNSAPFGHPINNYISPFLDDSTTPNIRGSGNFWRSDFDINQNVFVPSKNAFPVECESNINDKALNA